MSTGTEAKGLKTIEATPKRRRVFRAGVGRAMRIQAEAARQRSDISYDWFDLRRDRVVRLSCCSIIWGWAVWDHGVEYPPGLPGTKKRLAADRFDHGTLMRMTRCCHRYIPPQSMDHSNQCYDCYIGQLDDGTVEEPGAKHRLPSGGSIIDVRALPKEDQEIIRASGRLPDDVRADLDAAEDSGETKRTRRRRTFQASPGRKSPVAEAWAEWRAGGGNYQRFISEAADSGYDVSDQVIS